MTPDYTRRAEDAPVILRDEAEYAAAGRAMDALGDVIAAMPEALYLSSHISAVVERLDIARYEYERAHVAVPR